MCTGGTKMIDFKKLDETHFVCIDKGNTRGELRIYKKFETARLPSRTILLDSIYQHELEKGTVISFEEAFNLAKEKGMLFWPSDSLSCYQIYFAIQDELGRELLEFPHLYIRYLGTKKRLVCPNESDKRLLRQYRNANALLGFQEDYEALSQEDKDTFDSARDLVDTILKHND